MKLEFILKDAIDEGFDSKTVYAALVDAEIPAIETFVEQLNRSKANSLRREVLRHLLAVAAGKDEAESLAILSRLLEISHHEVSRVITELARKGSPQALSLIREALNDDSKWLQEQAAKAIIQSQYSDNAELALQDMEELVRRLASKQLEKQEKTAALIGALRNESASVRRVAAWYMGRKIVTQAADVLIEQVQTEDDIEALRAEIWSLGMLHDAKALPQLRNLTEHPNTLIATTARESLSRLTN
jgi:HEAT repeat protein